MNIDNHVNWLAVYNDQWYLGEHLCTPCQLRLFWHKLCVSESDRLIDVQTWILPWRSGLRISGSNSNVKVTYGTKIDFAMMNNTTELEEAKAQIMWSICRSTASSFAEQWRNTWLISRELKGNLSLSCSSNSHLSSCKSCLGSSSLSRMKGRSSLGEDRYGTNARHKHAQS